MKGFWQHGAVAVEIFYSMLGFMLTSFGSQDPIKPNQALFDEHGKRFLHSDTSALPLGVYYINHSFRCASN